MTRSGYVAAAETAVQYVRKSVRYRGLNTAGGWIRHPLEIPQKFAARIDSLRTGARRSEAAMNSPQPGARKFNPELYVNELDKLARDTGTGNCSELSAVAFNRLKTLGIKPVDYFACYRGNWDHAFLILNRDASIPISSFSQWSASAVICDPLYDRVHIAGMLAVWFPRVLPLKPSDVILRIQ